MFRFHLVRNLRTAFWLLLFALIPLAAGALYWANKTGLPEEWREAIENEISRRGVHVEIGPGELPRTPGHEVRGA